VRSARRPDAVRDALLALVASRALVWLAGVIAFEVAGTRDPRVPHIGAVGDALVAPITRWDSIHLEAIALHGYRHEDLTAFFPLYPLLARAVSEVTGSLLVGGALVSLVSFFAGLVIVHRLAELELGPAAARRTVWLLAFFPAALFFSAFYTEALFLALTAGAVYLARRGRFGWACAVGALASATRNTGVLVAVPIALLYLYGPREDRPGPGRHPIRPDALWILLVPAGLVAFSIYQWARFGDPLATWHVQTFWSRGFHGPFSAVWYAIPKTWQATYELFTGSHDTFESPIAKLALGGALGLAVVSVVGLFRRMPVAYGAYVVVALFAPLSSPWPAHPLMSLPRFLAVLFPIHMWLALHTAPPRRFAVVLVASGAMLAVLSVKFATWGWAG
jgi:Mannosyltransferase (PIG-V)